MRRKSFGCHDPILQQPMRPEAVAPPAKAKVDKGIARPITALFHSNSRVKTLVFKIV